MSSHGASEPAQGHVSTEEDSLLKLPDVALQSTSSRLHLFELAALCCCCQRLHRLVSEQLCELPSQQQHKQEEVVTTFQQAAHHLCNLQQLLYDFQWRDQLLLAAAQRAAAAAGGPSEAAGAGGAAHAPPPAAAAAAGVLPPPPATPQQSQQTRSLEQCPVDFSSFFNPGAGALAATLCVISDGHASAFLGQPVANGSAQKLPGAHAAVSSGSAHSGSSTAVQAQPAAAAAAAGGSQQTQSQQPNAPGCGFEQRSSSSSSSSSREGSQRPGVRLQHPASHPYCSGAVAPPLLQLVRGHLPPLLPASRYTPTPGLMNMPAVLAALLSHMPRLQQLLLLPPDRAAVAPWEESWPLQLSYVPVFKPQGLAPALMVPCWPEQGGWWGQAQLLLRHLQLPLSSVHHLDVSWQDVSDQQLAALIHPGLVTLAAAGTSAAGMVFMLLGTVWASHPSGGPHSAAASCGHNNSSSSSSGGSMDSSSSSESGHKEDTGGVAAAGAQRGRTMVHRRSSNGPVGTEGAPDPHSTNQQCQQQQQGPQSQHALSQQGTGGGRTSASVAAASAGAAGQVGASAAAGSSSGPAAAAAGVDGLRPALLWDAHLAAPALQRLDLSSCPALQQGGATGGAFHLLRAALGRLVHLTDLRLQAVNVDALCHPAVQAQQAPPRQPQGALGPDTGAQPPPPWVLTLRRLQQLDVSSALSLSPAAAAWLLLNGGCLRRLDMSDCRTLAAGGGVDQLQQLLQCAAGPTTPAGPSDPDHRNSSSSSSGGSGRATPAPTTATTGLGLPSLCHLCVGWGFSTHTLAWLLRCSPALTRLEVGQGANADDSLLRLLAAACPHLRHLRLSLAAVTSTGVGVVLQGCRGLRALQLVGCAGPWSIEDLLPSYHHQHNTSSNSSSSKGGGGNGGSGNSSGSGGSSNKLGTVSQPADQIELKRTALSSLTLQEQQQQQDGHIAQQECAHPHDQQQWHREVGGMPIGRQPLHDLQLCSSSSMHASSSQLLQLLGLPWQQPGVQARPTRLQVLALVGIRGVDNSFLAALTAAGCPQLRHLRLEECYRCDCDSRRGCREGADRVSSSSSSRGAAPEQQQVSPCRPTGPAFTQDALLALLPACPALHSLRLRHVAPLTAGFCRSVAAAAPLLRHLLVDGCDLGGVPWVRLAPDPHGALVEVQVMRCRDLDASGAASHALDLRPPAPLVAGSAGGGDGATGLAGVAAAGPAAQKHSCAGRGAETHHPCRQQQQQQQQSGTDSHEQRPHHHHHHKHHHHHEQQQQPPCTVRSSHLPLPPSSQRAGGTGGGEVHAVAAAAVEQQQQQQQQQQQVSLLRRRVDAMLLAERPQLGVISQKQAPS